MSLFLETKLMDTPSVFQQVHNFALPLFCFDILFSKITLRQKNDPTMNLLIRAEMYGRLVFVK